MVELPGFWPHQPRGVDGVLAAIASGQRKVCLTSPTGMGKTLMVAALLKHYLDRGLRCSVYTNRRLLLDQSSGVLARWGFEFGVRAAGHEDNRDRPLQLSSIQTEDSRSLRKHKWDLHPAELVVIDEAHCMTGATATQIVNAHHEQGAAVVGVTATPIDLSKLYSVLVTAGTVSEGRACGALVPCTHYGPDEPDLRHVGKRAALGADLPYPDVKKAMMTPCIFARVYEWWKRLNPDARPAILFAPGVPESLWFAEQFAAKGVTAAHIDGEDVWLNGVTYKSDRAAREAAMEGSRDGSVRVLCNRFVLREGVDAPWLCHGILATVFGSLQSYLQSGGRLLRRFPGVEAVTLQDHGGNWWRHGSLNADRTWDLTRTPAMHSGLREERLRSKQEKEPARCPQCSQILAGTRCPCGFVLDLTKKSRPVVQSDGTLQEMPGDVYRPRVTRTKGDTIEKWRKVYYRARNSGMTWRQAEGLFFAENGYFPPHTLPLMPKPDDGLEWFRPVKEFARGQLIGGQEVKS